MISHDHRFLDNVATHILDIDYETVLGYPGGYTGFLAAKAAERERREKEIALREREIAHHRQFVDRFRAKASKARQAQSRVRMIEKKAEGLVELPKSSRRYPKFRFEQRRPSGKEVVKVAGVTKSFGDNRVLDGVGLRGGARRPPRDRGPQRDRQVDAAQGHDGPPGGGRRGGGMGVRDASRLLRAGSEGPPGAGWRRRARRGGRHTRSGGPPGDGGRGGAAQRGRVDQRLLRGQGDRVRPGAGWGWSCSAATTRRSRSGRSPGARRRASCSAA